MALLLLACAPSATAPADASTDAPPPSDLVLRPSTQTPLTFDRCVPDHSSCWPPFVADVATSGERIAVIVLQAERVEAYADYLAYILQSEDGGRSWRSSSLPSCRSAVTPGFSYPSAVSIVGDQLVTLWLDRGASAVELGPTGACLFDWTTLAPTAVASGVPTDTTVVDIDGARAYALVRTTSFRFVATDLGSGAVLFDGEAWPSSPSDPTLGTLVDSSGDPTSAERDFTFVCTTGADTCLCDVHAPRSLDVIADSCAPSAEWSMHAFADRVASNVASAFDVTLSGSMPTTSGSIVVGGHVVTSALGPGRPADGRSSGRIAGARYDRFGVVMDRASNTTIVYGFTPPSLVASTTLPAAPCSGGSACTAWAQHQYVLGGGDDGPSLRWIEPLGGGDLLMLYGLDRAPLGAALADYALFASVEHYAP